jgi:DNA polymerase-1
VKPRMKLPPRELGALARKALAKSMVGIDKLTADIQKAVKVRGYLRGLDGRRVKIRSEHSALNTLLQGAGAIVMKKALVLFCDTALIHENYGAHIGLCASIHDEMQMECDPILAQVAGDTFADCIRQAGIELNVKCPLAGKAQVGDNWSQTH